MQKINIIMSNINDKYVFRDYKHHRDDKLVAYKRMTKTDVSRHQAKFVYYLFSASSIYLQNYVYVCILIMLGCNL